MYLKLINDNSMINVFKIMHKLKCWIMNKLLPEHIIISDLLLIFKISYFINVCMFQIPFKLYCHKDCSSNILPLKNPWVKILCEINRMILQNHPQLPWERIIDFKKTYYEDTHFTKFILFLVAQGYSRWWKKIQGSLLNNSSIWENWNWNWI